LNKQNEYQTMKYLW